MIHKLIYIILLSSLGLLHSGCSEAKDTTHTSVTGSMVDSLPSAAPAPEVRRALTGDDITITKDYRFDKYILEDTYAYKDTTRRIKWEVIRDSLAVLENAMAHPGRWAVLQNYKNMNGEAKVVKTWHRNEYKLVTDSLGIARYQSVPLYISADTITPRRYGRDGSPIHLLDSIGSFYRVSIVDKDEDWLVPRRYIKILDPDTRFTHAVFVDVSDQNIVLLSRESEGSWTALSTNPATTGKHNPPYGHETPTGIFMIQQKKAKMYYNRDGTNTIAGYAPYASRFTNGAYIHGVPTNNPNAKIIEYSASLGTTPRSHMCVRNASSHARFIYDTAPTERTFVVVIE